MGLDSEQYGLDFCKGEVDFTATNEQGPGDLRACMSFLQKKYGSEQLKAFLLANGVLDIGKMDDYAALISRAFEEIRQLFRDKARKDMRRMAGIVPS